MLLNLNINVYLCKVELFLVQQLMDGDVILFILLYTHFILIYRFYWLLLVISERILFLGLM